MEEGKKHYISFGMMALIVIIAIIADIATIIPVVGTVVGPLYFAAFSFYMWKIGLGFVNPRRLVTTILSTIAEIIPAVQELPAITVGTIIIFIFIRIQEKTGASVTSLASGKKPPLIKAGVRPPVIAKPPPLNSGGSRQPNGGLKPSNIVSVDFGSSGAEDLSKPA